MKSLRALTLLASIGLYATACGNNTTPGVTPDMSPRPDMGISGDMSEDMPVEDPEEVCDNGVDDNQSGQIDCEDPACEEDVACAVVLCQQDERVVGNACQACPAGSTNDAGDDASGSDTTCDATLCAEDERVAANACELCPAGTVNEAGDDASAADTGCDPVRCAEDEQVLENACVTCPLGTVNEAGDDAAGEDTTCDAVLCEEDTFVQGNLCVPCAEGLRNEAGDDASGQDTRCEDDCSVLVGVYCDAYGPTFIKPFNPVGRTDTKASNDFGGAIAIDGGFLAVGDPIEDGPSNPPDVDLEESGAVYLYERDAMGAWAEADYLKSSVAERVDLFGSAVALEGNLLAVGIPRDDSNDPADPANNDLRDAGAVMIYERESAGAWNESAYLKAQTPKQDENFGIALAFDGDTLAVAAIDSLVKRGSVDIFTRDATGVWSHQTRIVSGAEVNDERFGRVIDLSGDTLVVGNGLDEAFIFQRDATGAWSESDKLTPFAAGMGPYASSFGESVAIDGDRIVVGDRADSSDAAGINNPPMGTFARRSGAVYVYERVGPVDWENTAYIKPERLSESSFGTSVSIVGNVLAVGAPNDGSAAMGLSGTQPMNDDIASTGAVFLYGFDASGAVFLQAHIKSPVFDESDRLGSLVALSEDSLVANMPFESSGDGGVGADPLDNTAQRSGAVYVFGVTALER